MTARNLPEHARNPIHTDDGARAAGFPAALVAGVTTYAYLTHPLVAARGEAWVAHGGGEVRFRSPVFAGDELVCTPREDDGSLMIDAIVDGGPARASLRCWTDAEPSPADLRVGEELAPVRLVLTGGWGMHYGREAGDDLALYDTGVIPPAVWPALANHVVHAQVARGSWIHLRSRIQHHGLAHDGDDAVVTATVVDRFQRSGERAVLDVRIEAAGRVVATIEHEAIVALP